MVLQKEKAMPKLTKRFVETIQPHPTDILKYWDTELKGFGVVILPSGRRTYCVKYRNAERVQKRFKIGVHGQITAEEARNLAKIHLGKVAHGEDLAETAKQVRNMPTVSELAQDYLDLHAEKNKEPKSIKEDKSFLRRFILPAFGSQKVASIDRRSIEILHLQLSRTPTQANRVLSLLSKMFTLANAWGWREENPVKGIKKYHEEKRNRWLNQKELNRLWEVLDRYPRHLTAYFLKLLVLTGARSGEALKATWDQFDFESGVWTKPSHSTKQKKMEHLPISVKTVSVLLEVKKFSKPGNPYVFPGRIKGERLKEPKRFWGTVTKAANLEDVHIHDLRHTHASHLVSKGSSLCIVGKLLGHTQPSTTQRYAHLADEPLRQAAELFSSQIDESGSRKVV
jgi:integrase